MAELTRIDVAMILNTNKNFAGLDLRHMDFSESNLWHTNLKGTLIDGINFLGAQLGYTDLSGRDLRLVLNMSGHLGGTNLSNSILSRVNLWGAYKTLRDADLTNSDLSYVDLSGADLKGARLRGAKIIGVVMNEEDIETGYQGTVLPDGTKYKQGMDLRRFT